MQAILPTSPLNKHLPLRVGMKGGVHLPALQRLGRAVPAVGPHTHVVQKVRASHCIRCIFHITWLQMQAIDFLGAQFKKQQLVSTLEKTSEKERSLPSNGIWKSHFWLYMSFMLCWPVPMLVQSSPWLMPLLSGLLFKFYLNTPRLKFSVCQHDCLEAGASAS